MKKEKYIVYLTTISILGFAMLVALPTKAHATDSTATTSTTTTTTTAQTQRMQNLKTRADAEISKRLTALNSLTYKVSSLKKISSDQKTAFTTDIQNNITALTALKLKIDADTDPTILQADVKSIVDSYRIFALYVPKINLLTGSDLIDQIATNFTSVVAKLQTEIMTEQQAGKDVTSLQTKLNDITTKMTDASNQSQTITLTTISLEPSEYPSNSSSLQNAQQMIKAARADIKTATQDAQQIIASLKNLKK